MRKERGAVRRRRLQQIVLRFRLDRGVRFEFFASASFELRVLGDVICMFRPQASPPLYLALRRAHPVHTRHDGLGPGTSSAMTEGTTSTLPGQRPSA
jgi:hypothetical protein